MQNVAEPTETGRKISKLIGHDFSQTDVLMQALTHASASDAPLGDYERLEFLGDRVLGLVIAQLLYLEFPGADEGELSRRFNLLVNAETCADVAEEIGLDAFIVTGTEIRSVKGRKRLNLRADVIESIIAAVYLDGGFEAAQSFIERFWQPRAHASDADRRDAKTELQEWAHRNGNTAPKYQIEARSGPDHDPVFTVVAIIEGLEMQHGVGRSKREAEQAAASAILVREGIWPEQRPKS